MIYLDIAEKIESLRKELYLNIEKYGIESNQTRETSRKFDKLLNQYVKNKKTTGVVLKGEYELAYKELKSIKAKTGKFPTTSEWNKYAKDNWFLNSETIKYIGNMSWEELEQKINEQ